MSTDDLRAGLAKEDTSEIDLSKYDTYDEPEEEGNETNKAPEKEAKKVPVAPRRSAPRKAFGRR
jgi:hypothetical protein